MVLKSTSNRTSPPGGVIGLTLRLLLRISQIIISIITAALYGKDIGSGNHSSGWIFAIIVSILSFLTASIYLLPILRSHKTFIWDAILFLFWTALFGAFANIYLHRTCKTGCRNMKTAMWFDLVGMLLWLLSAVAGAILFFKERRAGYAGSAV
ncbi:hypothetical protein BZA77DRAFT_309312 [Pyronema omphalodes]|nr:hypothetical protein BZA77DRAFT_309312 [Pyronema omphalodes]